MERRIFKQARRPAIALWEFVTVCKGVAPLMRLWTFKGLEAAGPWSCSGGMKEIKAERARWLPQREAMWKAVCPTRLEWVTGTPLRTQTTKTTNKRTNDKKSVSIQV